MDIYPIPGHTEDTVLRMGAWSVIDSLTHIDRTARAPRGLVEPSDTERGEPLELALGFRISRTTDSIRLARDLVYHGAMRAADEVAVPATTALSVTAVTGKRRS